MISLRYFAFACALALAAGVLSRATAQSPTLSLTTDRDTVRLEAPDNIQTVRLRILSPAGKQVFDSGIIEGQEVEWNLLDVEGRRVPDGVYLARIMLTDETGRRRWRTEQVIVARRPPANPEPRVPGIQPPSNTGESLPEHITKRTSSSAISDSVMVESAGKIGVNTTAPAATLHIYSPQPATSASAGTDVPLVLQTSGGKGGNTTSSGVRAGNGAGVAIFAGNGGDAPSGSVNGNGGSITLQPGAAGSGLGNAGSAGSVLLAPAGGNVGVGTVNPTSTLTVMGMIESKKGGIKFPDGTVQVTAAGGSSSNSSSTEGDTDAVDATLKGDGTSGSPLGVAVPLQLTGALDNGGIISALNNGNGNGVSASGRIAISGAGTRMGISGTSSDDNGIGVFGTNSGSGGFGVYGSSSSSAGQGVRGESLSQDRSTGLGTGVVGLGYVGVIGENLDLPSNHGNSDGVRGVDNSTTIGSQGHLFNGVVGLSTFNTGVRGESQHGIGVIGKGDPAIQGVGVTIGVQGDGDTGVNGNGNSTGVVGNGNVGVNGNGNTGVIGIGNVGVEGISTGGQAGLFQGDVQVTGMLSKGGGSFKIDHPLDPANKYLYHSFVESPDMKNIYDGVVVLDQNGEAVVHLPDWFQALNRDFRYQLTCIGGFAPVYIAEEVANNHFRIAGGKAGMKISWQVTGIRQDAFANAHRIPVEEAKPKQERGYYLHPELFGAPEEKGVEWARHPEQMQKIKESAEKRQALAPQQSRR